MIERIVQDSTPLGARWGTAVNTAKPIRVLHVTSSKAFYGAERVIVTLSRYLRRQGVGVCIANIEKKRASSTAVLEAARASGLKVEWVPCKGWFDWGTVKYLKTIVEKQNISVLHCHESKSRLYGVIASRLTGVPVVTTLHGWTRQDWRTTIVELVDVGFLGFCDEVVAVSGHTARSIGRRMARSGGVPVITNGIDLEEFDHGSDEQALRKSLGLPLGARVIGTVGRLTVEKGHDLIIEAARGVLDARKDVAFLIVGDGAEMTGLKAMAQNLGLGGRIIFAGYREDVRPFLSLMDIFVMPSRTEGTPMALLEAMAMEKPVVVTPVGGMAAIVSSGINGIVLRNRDASQLTEVILRLLTDGAMATRLATQARLLVESEYSARRMAEQYEAVYRKCLESAGVSHPEAGLSAES